MKRKLFKVFENDVYQSNKTPKSFHHDAQSKDIRSERTWSEDEIISRCVRIKYRNDLNLTRNLMFYFDFLIKCMLLLLMILPNEQRN